MIDVVQPVHQGSRNLCLCVWAGVCVWMWTGVCVCIVWAGMCVDVGGCVCVYSVGGPEISLKLPNSYTIEKYEIGNKN